jgi:hippurate hydrolase
MLKEKINRLAEDYSTDLIAIRRHLHKYPELSFQEFETSAYIQSVLQDWGISFTSGIVKTGIVGIIEGRNPKKRTIALRADIDALPIVEENDVTYKSCNNGVMHACGHDVHTTCLLGALKILNETKLEWEGSVKFIFQPGEERIPGGASLMIKEGVLENPKPDAIIGLHVLPQMEVGNLGFKSGMFMASADEIYITLNGKGGHAAIPQSVIDPILMAAHLLTTLQQVVSRNAPPIVPSVLSFGKIIGNGATNVIPDKVILEGTFRTFDEKWRATAHQRISEICTSVAQSFGGSCDLEIRKGYPFLVNDETLNAKVEELSKGILGSKNVHQIETRMTAEDFAYYSQIIPACFFRLGTGNMAKGINSGIHTSTFDVDEEAIKIGVKTLAYAATMA